MNVAFPLRDGYFRPLEPTAEQEAHWKEHVQGLVQRSLAEEAPYFASDYEFVDRRQWKLVRRKDQLRVFSPRSGTSSLSGDGSAVVPCLLEIGTIEGTLEDVVFGVHNTTSHDMRVTTSFLSADALDSAVLHVFENGCDEDPFRSFALKWRILETPAGTFVKNRDVCAFEYMGISRDCGGVPFAFHICESFDHPVCPPFHPQCAIRAKTQTCIIYRQIRPGRVGVYYRGEYTTGGRIPLFLARWTAAEVAISVGRSVECAEAKKLTAIALAAASSGALDSFDGRRHVPRRDRVRSADAVRSCSICDHSISHKTLHLCQVCGLTVCGKCRSRKYLLSDEGKLQVACCKQCLVAVKTVKVDPRRPLGLISAAHWHSHGVIVSTAAHTPALASYNVDVINLSSRGAPQPPLAIRVEDRRRVRAWTEDPDDRHYASEYSTPGSSSRRSAFQRAKDKQKAREDVYELLAAMSVTSEDTVTSTASRDEGVVFTSGSLDEEELVSPREDALRPAAPVASTLPMAVATGPQGTGGQLWEQIKQLRLAAEQTYRMTKQQSDEWVQRLT